MALVGAGSSAIQILPRLQKKCDQVHHFVRGRTWVSEPFGSVATQRAIAGDKDSGNCEYSFQAYVRITHNQSDSYSAEELKKFREDPEFYWSYRKEIERYINLDHSCLFPDTPAATGSKQRIIENMKLKLAKKPDIFDAIQPDFRPGCRRLTPGPGFLEALVEDNVHFTTSPITSVTKDVSFKQP